jgi:hypothetical protein
MLQRNSLPAAANWLKHRYQRVLPAVMTAHVLTHGRVIFGAPVSQGGGVRLALRATERVTQALTAFMRDHRAQLSAAVASPAQGVTLTFTFPLGRVGAPAHGDLALPQVAVRPGYHDGRRPVHGRSGESEALDVGNGELEALDGGYGG